MEGKSACSKLISLRLRKKNYKDIHMIKFIICYFQLASVHGEPNVVTTVHMVIMDSVVVKSAIVVIYRYVIQNKDVLSLKVNLKKKGGGGYCLI